MRFHRAISLFTLATFLPLAVGCSSRQSVTLDSDPGDGSAAILPGEPTRIQSYTTTNSGTREWDGEVSVVGADSLEFTRLRPGTGGNTNQPPEAGIDQRRESMRLSRAEVLSVEIVDRHPGRSIALVLGLYVLVMAGIAAATFESGEI